MSCPVLLPCGSPDPRTSLRLHHPRSKCQLSCHYPHQPYKSDQWLRLDHHGMHPEQDGQCCFPDPKGRWTGRQYRGPWQFPRPGWLSALCLISMKGTVDIHSQAPPWFRSEQSWEGNHWLSGDIPPPKHSPSNPWQMDFQILSGQQGEIWQIRLISGHHLLYKAAAQRFRGLPNPKLLHWVSVDPTRPFYREHIRFTIQPSLAAIRTIGLTPVAAIAATDSCICQSSSSIFVILRPIPIPRRKRETYQQYSRALYQPKSNHILT